MAPGACCFDPVFRWELGVSDACYVKDHPCFSAKKQRKATLTHYSNLPVLTYFAAHAHIWFSKMYRYIEMIHSVIGYERPQWFTIKIIQARRTSLSIFLRALFGDLTLSLSVSLSLSLSLSFSLHIYNMHQYAVMSTLDYIINPKRLFNWEGTIYVPLIVTIWRVPPNYIINHGCQCIPTIGELLDLRQQRCANSWRVLRCSAPILRPSGSWEASSLGAKNQWVFDRCQLVSGLEHFFVFP